MYQSQYCVKHHIRHRIKKHIGVHHISTWKSFILAFSIIISGTFGIGYSIRAYPVIFQTDVSMEKRSNIRLNETLVIDFSFPMPSDAYSNIEITPAREIDFHWQNPKRLLIKPKKFWEAETDYTLNLIKSRNAMFSTVEGQKLSFFTQSFPQVASVLPNDKAKEVVIDIEDPIVVNFSESPADFFIKFELEPKIELAYQNNPDKTRFELMPKQALEEGRRYELKISAKFIEDSDEGYGLIHRSSFETPIPPPEVVWEKNYDLRLAQAKKITRPKISSGKYIDVNLEAQVLGIFEDGKNLDFFMISSGKRGMDTPKGETKIYNKFPRAYSKEYGLFMPHWMAVAQSGKFGLHELPEWPNGYKEGTSHLGTPVSHGCVRLGVGAAKTVYEWAEIGTPVVIY